MDVAVHDHQAESRYEARSGSELVGIAEYVLDGGALVFTHTEVEPEHRGQGIAQTLARFALDDARSNSLKVVPRCSFFQRYLDTHPQYSDLVAI